MIQVLVLGLTLGALYAIVALGYTMVYGIIELINFAHGDVFTFGAFVAVPVVERLVNQTPGYNPSVLESVVGIGVAMMVAAIACGVLGVVIERVAYRPLRNAPRLAPLITAIGVSLIIENALFQWRGGQQVFFPKAIQTHVYPFLGTTITNVQILVILVAIAMMGGLDLFVNRTGVGKAMRAVAQDREAASMMGIDVNFIISMTFFIGSALAGGGAVIYGLYEIAVGYNSGFSLGLFAFTAAVLGGIGNIRGAMLGGLAIGIVTAWVQGLGNGAGSEWYDVATFGILIVILVFRPAGLLGSSVAEKV